MPTKRDARAVIRTGSWTLGVNAGAKLQALAIIVAGAVADGLAGVGVASAGYAFAILGATMADFGYSTEIARFISRNPSRNAIRIATRGGQWRSIIAFAAGALLPLAGLELSSMSIVALGLTAVSAMWISLLSQVLYGLFRHRSAALSQFLARSLSALLLPFAALGLGTDGIVWVLALGEAVCAAALSAATRRAWRESNEVPLDELPSKRHVWLGVGGLVSTLMNRRDTALIAAVAAPTVVGVYSIASQLQNAVTTVALVPAGAVPNHVAASHRGGSDEHSTVTRVSALVALISLLGGAATVGISWVPVVQERLQESADLASLRPALLLVMLAAPLAGASAVLISASVARDRHRDVGLAWIVMGGVGVPVIVLLTAQWGVVGAAAGAVVRDALAMVAGLICWGRARRA